MCAWRGSAKMYRAVLANIRPAPEVSFVGADLRSASFSVVQLVRARFADADLRFTRIDDALLEGASFRGALLMGAAMVDTNCANCDLEGAVLDGNLMRNIRCPDAKLADASLRGSVITNAVMVRVNALGADFSDANAQVPRATRNCFAFQVELFEITRGTAPNLSFKKGRACISALEIVDYNMWSERLASQGSDFTGANLVNTLFLGTDVRLAKFVGAAIQGADFRTAVSISTADFAHAFGEALFAQP
eukprot:2633381-Pleurochrysis_carterae.AAC.11